MPSKAPALTESGRIGDYQPQKQPEQAGNGLPSPALGAVRVYRAAAGGMVEIAPPAVGANVVTFALTRHPAKVKCPVRRTLIV